MSTDDPQARTAYRYTEADIAAAVQAERAASYAAVQRQIGTGNKGDFPVWNAAVEACLAAIIARGDTSALAGLLAEEFHKGWRKGQDDALESAKPEIAATASALAAAVEAARDEGRIEGATLAAAELAEAVEAARREEREACAVLIEERAEHYYEWSAGELADSAAFAIRARSGGKEGA